VPGLERARRYAVDTVRLSRVAGSRLERARFGLVRTLFVLRALAGRSGRARSVTVSEGQRRFRFCLTDAADFEVLREVFVEREYELDLDWEPELILDVGSNIGATIGFFRARYPRARIVGLEPDPRAFARLQANVGGLDGVRVLKVAAAATNGRRPFYPAASTWLSSLNPSARTGEEPIEVETRTLDSLLGELGLEHVDLLKIDVEGAEAEILPGFAGLAKVRAVVGEIHPDIVRDPSVLVRLLEERFELEVQRPQPDRWRFKGVVPPDGAGRAGSS